MPELPEVESVVRRLHPELVNQTIEDVTVRWKRTVNRPSVPKFKKQLTGAKIKNVQRRAKFIVIELTKPESYLIGHLRMSGKLNVLSAELPLEKHDRVLFSLKNGKALRFNDVRKFGRFYLVDNSNEVLGKLGPEPLDDLFSAKDFYQMLHKRSGAIKPLLLNQNFIAGLGNIYVDESLWKARIHPLKTAKSVSRKKSDALYRAIRVILQQAIEAMGTDFGDNVVKEGDYTPKVYGRAGKKCKRCSTKIKRIVVAQRGSHICSKCQSLR